MAAVTQFDSRSRKRIARVVRKIENAPIDLYGNGLIRSGVFPWRFCSFGITDITGANVTIKGSTMDFGVGEVSVVDTTVVIATEFAYVGWEYQYSTAAFTIQNFGDSVARDPDYIRHWLYKFQKFAASGGAPDRVFVIEWGFMRPCLPANFGTM